MSTSWRLGGGGGAGNPRRDAGTVCSVSGHLCLVAVGNADTAGVAGTAIVATISGTVVMLNPRRGRCCNHVVAREEPRERRSAGPTGTEPCGTVPAAAWGSSNEGAVVPPDTMVRRAGGRGRRLLRRRRRLEFRLSAATFRLQRRQATFRPGTDRRDSANVVIGTLGSATNAEMAKRRLPTRSSAGTTQATRRAPAVPSTDTFILTDETTSRIITTSKCAGLVNRD